MENVLNHMKNVLNHIKKVTKTIVCLAGNGPKAQLKWLLNPANEDKKYLVNFPCGHIVSYTGLYRLDTDNSDSHRAWNLLAHDTNPRNNEEIHV